MQIINKNERKVLTMWAIVIVIVSAIVLLINIKFNGASLFQKITKQVETKYSLVKDRDRYYIVKSSIDSFYGYINDDNKKNLLKVLNEGYIKKNDISKDNVLDFFKYDNKVVIKANKFMCQRKIGEGKYSYYTQFIEQDRDTGEFIKNVYYEVILDNKTITYNVKPISEKTFGGACHGE